MKCSQSEVAKKYGISQAQVCKLLERKDSVLTDWRENLKLTRKRKRSGKGFQVEGDLMEWFREKRARNVLISGPILKQNAEQIAERRGKSEFKATNGWFCRWKNRNQVSFKKIQGEAKDADITGANKWVREVLPVPFIIAMKLLSIIEQHQMQRYVFVKKKPLEEKYRKID
ncbi:Tc5 transposase DNA-binding domain [Popillia japonica]|uniref:Tc5 transposase DNA-binding domain n=1 Tax=Popillia japonica TaxID=7064 RepID=A0AAW1HSL8_POPJA